ncbi:MAG: hypothetical protein ABIH87_02320 [bacterium]
MKKIILILTITFFLNGCTNNQHITISREQKIPTTTIKITSAIDIYPPILHSNEFKEPIPVPGSVNTAGTEDSSFVTPDGNTLYFFFTPDPKIPPQLQVLDQITGIYVAQKIDDQWQQVKRVVLHKPGKLSLDGCEFVQGDTMWFCSAREGYTGMNFFTAELKNGQWKNWKHVGDKLTKQYKMGEMHINDNGDELYFHSLREGGKGNYDIWMSKKQNGEWQTPENIIAVNSIEHDGWPYINKQGDELWFNRTYSGSPAIFKSKKIDGQWQKPELIVSQFAGEPSLDDQGNLYFTHHYYKNSQMLEADIFVAYKK